MIVPTLDRWEAGDQPNDVTFNTLMSTISFLQSPPEGHFTQITGQSIPNAAWTAVQWNTVIRDNEAEYDSANPMWSVGGGNTKIYSRTRGWYEMEYSSHWPAVGDSLLRLHAIRVNGIEPDCQYYGRNDQRNISDNKNRSVYDLYLDAGAYIELMVYQNSGGALALNDGGATGSRTSMRLRWYSL